MIYISKEQLKQVEYLIHQSIQGNHILFDSDTVKRLLSQYKLSQSEADLYSVEHHIERIIELQSLREKKIYFERLDERTQAYVLQTYLNIVENNLFEQNEVRH